MDGIAAELQEAVASYAAVLERVSVGGRFEATTSPGSAARLLADQELLQATAALARIARLTEAHRVGMTGQLISRSEVSDGSSLARRMGATGPSDLLAQVSGIPRDHAGTLTRLAEAVRPRESLTGDPLPPERAHVAAALNDGRIDPTVAAALARALRKVDGGLTPVELEDLERQLVERSQEGYTADELIAHFRDVPSYANPDGDEPTEARLAAAAQVTKRDLDNGLTRWVLDLDPLTNGFFETALGANTSSRRFRIELDDAPRLDDQDRRPLAKRRVDGVRLIAKKALQVDDGQVAGTAVTMLVTISEDALKSGVGTALLPECRATITASTARMLAAEAEIIPVVLGGRSKVLDLGTERRFFTEAQRYAMALRDGGCAGPCCDAPLSWCDAAHRRPAGYGPTSLDNGLLLCWRCHLLLDKHGWQVDREHDRWWWTPPPWIDPTGRRRPGGRIPALDRTE